MILYCFISLVSLYHTQGTNLGGDVVTASDLQTRCQTQCSKLSMRQSKSTQTLPSSNWWSTVVPMPGSSSVNLVTRLERIRGFWKAVFCENCCILFKVDFPCVHVSGHAQHLHCLIFREHVASCPHYFLTYRGARLSGNFVHQALRKLHILPTWSLSLLHLTEISILPLSQSSLINTSGPIIKHRKEMCWKEIGLWAQNVLIILGSRGNLVKGPIWPLTEHGNLHLDCGWDIHASSKIFEANGCGHDLDLLIVSL